MLGLNELELRTYIAEPDRGPRNWHGKAKEKAAVYGNRRRVQGNRGKSLQRQRGVRIERNFAHQFDTGGLDRLYVRGKQNVHKKLLIQAAACNLALLLRSRYGSGKPRAAHDGVVDAIVTILAVMKAVDHIFTPSSPIPYRELRVSRRSHRCQSFFCWPKTAGFDTGCYATAPIAPELPFANCQSPQVRQHASQRLLNYRDARNTILYYNYDALH